MKAHATIVNKFMSEIGTFLGRIALKPQGDPAGTAAPRGRSVFGTVVNRLIAPPRRDRGDEFNELADRAGGEAAIRLVAGG